MHDIIHTILDALAAIAVWYVKRAVGRRDARQEREHAELKHEVYVEIDKRVRPVEKHLGIEPPSSDKDSGVPD